MIRKCKHCNKEFEQENHSRRMYCSAACRQEARREQLRKAQHKFNEKKREETVGEKKACRWCGKEIPYARAERRMVYCSEECRKMGRREANNNFRRRRENQRPRRKWQPTTKLEFFLVAAEERGLTYAQAQMEETMERIRRTGSARVSPRV